MNTDPINYNECINMTTVVLFLYGFSEIFVKFISLGSNRVPIFFFGSSDYMKFRKLCLRPTVLSRPPSHSHHIHHARLTEYSNCLADNFPASSVNLFNVYFMF